MTIGFQASENQENKTTNVSNVKVKQINAAKQINKNLNKSKKKM